MPAKTLQGKNAIITGASSGIGAGIARNLASRGCNVILVARREERLRALQSEIEKLYQVKVQVIPLDLTEANAAESLYQKTEGAGTEVDILVNNAGLAIFGEYPEITWERERNLYEVDIIAVAHLTRTFLRSMLNRKSGHVLLIASVMGMMPVPTFSSYAGAKAFVVNYGKSLNYELRNSGVNVTVASPGTTDSEFFNVAGQDITLAEKMTMMSSEKVAQLSVQAMLKRKPVAVIGGVSLFAVILTKFLPARAAAWLTYTMMMFAPQKS